MYFFRAANGPDAKHFVKHKLEINLFDHDGQFNVIVIVRSEELDKDDQKIMCQEG